MKSFAKFLILTVLLAAFIAACAGKNSQITSKEYVLTTEMKDGNLIFLGVSDEINGIGKPHLERRSWRDNYRDTDQRRHGSA